MVNSFERFEAVLTHKKPDKMPFYFPTIFCTVASEILGRDINSGGDSLHFKEEFSWLNGKDAHEDFVEKYLEDAVELNRKLGADISRETWRSSERPSRKLDEYTLLFGKEDGPHKIKRFFPKIQSYGIVEDNTRCNAVEDLVRNLREEIEIAHEPSESEFLEASRYQIKIQELSRPYFPTIFGGLGLGIPMYDPIWLEATALETNFLSEYFLFRAEAAARQIKWISKLGFRWINGGGDLAANSGPVYSPEAFKTIMVEPHKILADECRKNNMIYCYRTDGNLERLFKYMFDETGIQAYGEVDRDAGMSVEEVRRNLPRVIILGNISSALLNNGTVEQVRTQTRNSLVESGGYNYIPGPSNAILHGTPVENVYAMVQEIEEYSPSSADEAN